MTELEHTEQQASEETMQVAETEQAAVAPATEPAAEAADETAAPTAAQPKSRNRTLTIIQIALAICAVAAFAFVGIKVAGYTQAQDNYSKMQQQFTAGDKILFPELTAEYPNAVAWIRVDGLPTIDYPVMHTDNNDFYLNHDPAGNASVSGSIFLDYRNQNITEDLHVLVYGHNMLDGSMFGTLAQYQNEDFYKSNGGTFTIYTPTGNHKYQIFAVNVVDPNNDIFMVGFKDPDVFAAFVKTLKDNSMYDTGVSINDAKQVITLSTCTDTDRLVVSAKRVS